MKRETMAQTFGLAFGAVYVLVGIVGFFVTAGVGFAASEGDKLFGLLELNPLHNVVHLLIGGFLIVGSGTALGARAVNSLVGLVYLVVGVVGFALVDKSGNLIAVNIWDNVLHLATAVVALTLGRSIGAQPAAP